MSSFSSSEAEGSNGARAQQPQTPIAITGIGLRLAGGVRGADGLWNRLRSRETQQAGASAEEEAADPVTEDEQNDQLRQTLLEVAYEALQDGANPWYRGEEARVGVFVSGNAQQLEGDSSMANQVSRRYDLSGPR
jgi:hypothetical protein